MFKVRVFVEQHVTIQTVHIKSKEHTPQSLCARVLFYTGSLFVLRTEKVARENRKRSFDVKQRESLIYKVSGALLEF